MSALNETDSKIFAAIENEIDRQRHEINLIASENVVSKAVLEAMGSVMTNKYAEGYPAKRWYGGCDFVDQAEDLARDRAKELFGAEHANVQPHAGSPANMAAYHTLIEPGDTILAMDLAHGGHLTHGSPVNFSGKAYNVVAYGVNKEDCRISMDHVRALAQEHKPKVIVAGASNYSRTLDFAAFADIAHEVGAKLMVDMAHIAGLVAAGLHPNPVPHADVVTTTTHKTLRGPRGGLVLCKEPHAKKLDSSVFPGLQGGPFMHMIAAKAVAFHEALQPTFKNYQQQVLDNTRTLCETLQGRGFDIVSGGTDNHLFTLDLSKKDFSGNKACKAMQSCGIVTNKNAIPFDERKVTLTSGVRIGAPGVTSRGMGQEDMQTIGNWMADILEDIKNEDKHKDIAGQVREFAAKFDIYC